MPNRTPARASLLLAAAVLLAGCGNAAATPPGAGSAAPARTAADEASPAQHAPARGSQSPAPSSPKALPKASRPPSAAATMVCSAETRANIATLLGLATNPRPRSTWAHDRYTCTYPLAQGRLVMSVQQSPTSAAARRHFADVKASAGHTTALTGLASLGLPAFQTRTGVVSFVKDTFTLHVDATAMEPSLGPHHTSRTDFAYTLATDILGCWTGK